MRMQHRLLAILVFVALAALPAPSSAQDNPSQPSSPSTAPATPPPAPRSQTPSQDSSTQQSQNAMDKHAKDEVPKRIFFIIPNFMTANDQPENQGPLTTKQKFNIAWHQWYDFSAHFGNVIQAGISQAANGIPHYGQGWGAFGERYAAQEGDQFTGSMIIYGVLPTVLKIDPRYFRKGRGTAFSRIEYATTRVVIARTDSGKKTVNIPTIFGQLCQAAISLTYYAKQDRDVHGLFEGWAVNQAYNIGWNQLKEFTPDLGAVMKREGERRRQRKLEKQQQQQQQTAPAGPSAYVHPPNLLKPLMQAEVDTILESPAGPRGSLRASGR
jgi:hypothetical protein